MRIYFDLETYSATDLKRSNAYRYREDPDFLILMMAWAIDDEEVEVELDDPKAVFDRLRAEHPDATWVAHNSQFDRVCLSPAGGPFLDPRMFDDTMPRAAEWGYPMSLDKLAKALGAQEKDTAGTRLINKFSKPKPDGTRRLPQEAPEDWAAFVEYCRQDVATLREVDRLLGDWPTTFERDLWVLDQEINDRGVPVDLDLAQAAVRANDQNMEEFQNELETLLDIENARSVTQLRAGLDKQGLEVPDLRADTVRGLLEQDDLRPPIRRALELRQLLAGSAVAKYNAVLRCANADDRFRGGVQFFGAGPGRWAGRGIGLQNLPRKGLAPGQQAAAMFDTMHGLGATPQELKMLIRPLILGPITVVDFSAIEARVLAWVSNETWALEAFYEGRDLYVETAKRMRIMSDGRPDRQRGKAAVLGLGYSGAVRALRNVGATGTDEELWELTNAWREANPQIVATWNRLMQAFTDTGQVNDKLSVVRARSGRAIRLPSGRHICYRRMHWKSPTKEDIEKGFTKKSLAYINGRGESKRIWRGICIENVSQAIARDLLAAALLRLEAAGYRVIMHVHDEVLIEGAHNVSEIAAIMCQDPGWASGLPLAAEGAVMERYGKAA